MLLDIEIQRDGSDVKVIGLPAGFFLISVDVDEPVYDLWLSPPSWDRARSFQREWSKTTPAKVRLALGSRTIAGIVTEIGLGFGLSGNRVHLRIVDSAQSHVDPRDESISNLYAPLR
jgi:hypothetical protein